LCPDFGSIYKQLSLPKPFKLDDRLQKNMQKQDDQQSKLRTAKQTIPKGKLIVTETQAKQAIKSGNENSSLGIWILARNFLKKLF
jgi:hypothetical protein